MTHQPAFHSTEYHMASSADALLATLDALIERHGRDNPELR